MSLEQHIEDIIAPTLLERGCGVVRVQLQGANRKILQIMIENIDGTPISIDECAHSSRAISLLLDVEDPIHEPYVLEVSSPGLDRPLVKKVDFERYVGSKVKIELKTPVEGSRRFSGLLLGVEGDLVKIQWDLEKKVAEFALSDIQKAKIVPDL